VWSEGIEPSALLSGKRTSRIQSCISFDGGRYSLYVKRFVALKIDGKEFLLPRYSKGDKPFILLPQELLKPLPIALDIEEALNNADLNQQICDTRFIRGLQFAAKCRLGVSFCNRSPPDDWPRGEAAIARVPPP
jgi:hypothetical protein